MTLPPVEPTVPEILALARARLLQPGVWLQGGLAKDARGFEVNPTDERAIRFDATAAICNADGSSHYNPSPAVQALARTIGVNPEKSYDPTVTPFVVVSHFNDAPGRTLAEVLAMFDKAAKESDGN